LPGTFKTIVDLTLDPTFDYDHGLTTPGEMKNFISDVKTYQFVDIKSLTMIGTKAGKTYYGYQFNEVNHRSIIYILVPAGYTA